MPPPIPLHNRFAPKPPTPTTHDRLIEVLAWDDQLDEAWALATEHGCSGHLWNSLAAARRTTTPSMRPPSTSEVERQIARQTTHAYGVSRR